MDENMQAVRANDILFFNQIIGLSDSESSDSDDEELIRLLQIRVNRPKIQDYIENVVDQYSNEEFRENFRMFRETFNFILNLIKNKVSSSIVDKGRHTIDAKTQLLLCIWYLATPDSYRSICGRFNVGKATGFRTIRRVVQALCEISPQFICWPSDEELADVKEGFSNYGFKDVIGCIDGSYIYIPLPAEDSYSYICRKNLPAIILQAVCDHQLLFTHCYAGEVGSSHDASVFKKSEVWDYATVDRVNKFPENSYLLGDKAYPCFPTLITPYKNNGHLTREQNNFNYKHSSTRSAIERSFALLKKRFRCMKFLDVRKVDFIPKIIIACCVLHNICILQNDILNLNDEDIEEDNAGDLDNIILNPLEERRLKHAGILKRNELCAEINLN